MNYLLPPTHIHPGCWRLNIDFMDGCIVHRESDHLVRTIQLLTDENIPICLIDINRSKKKGHNDEMIRNILQDKKGYFWVGGGISNLDRIHLLLETGAKGVILSSAIYENCRINRKFLSSLITQFDTDQLILSIDFYGDEIRTNGFDKSISLQWERGLEEIFEIAPFQIQLVDVQASSEKLKPNLPLLQAFRQKYSEPVLWYAGNVGSWQMVETLFDMNICPTVGQAYLRNTLGLCKGE